MSIIRATRQKGGYSSDHKATSYGGVTDEPAFKPKREAGAATTHIMEKSKISGKDFQPYGQVFACRFFYAP